MKNKTPVKQEETRVRDSRGRWNKNHSGNSKGRPKKSLCITDLLREVGEEKLNGSSHLELVVRKAYEMAIGGDMRAINFITERLEGRPPIKEIDVNETLPEGMTITWIGEDGKTDMIDHPDGTREIIV